MGPQCPVKPWDTQCGHWVRINPQTHRGPFWWWYGPWWCTPLMVEKQKPPRRTWMAKCSRALRLCALTRRLLMDYGFPSYPQYPYCTFHTWLFGWTTPHVTTYSTDFDSSEVCKTTDCTTFSWITGHLAGFPWGSFCQGSEPLRCFQLSQGKTCAFYLNNNQIVFL